MLRLFKPILKKKRVINPEVLTHASDKKDKMHKPNRFLSVGSDFTVPMDSRKGFLKDKQVKIKSVINPEMENRKRTSTVVIAEKSVAIAPSQQKHHSFSGGSVKPVLNKLINEINKLYRKQKKNGLTQKERTKLAEYQKQLRNVAATREGTTIRKIRR